MTGVGRSGQPQASPVLEVLTEDECWQRLRGQRLGRIVVTVAGRLEVFPVNFAVADGVIAFRTGSGTKLSAAVEAPKDGAGAPCVFEVDSYDDRPAMGWSVIARGGLFPVSGAAAERLRRAGLDVRPDPPGDRPYWLVIEVDDITGRAFSAGSMIPYWS